MNPFDGFALEDLIQFLVLILFIGAPIVRAIYGTFVKPVKKAGQRQGRPERAPPQLKDFLKEVRREREARQGKVKPAAPEGFEQWEEVPEPPRPEPRPEPRAEPRPQPQHRPAARVDVAPARQRPAAGVPVPTSGAEEAARRNPLSRRLEEREISGVADRHIHSHLEDRELDANLEDRHLQDRLSRQLDAKFGQVKRRRNANSKDIPGFPKGVGIREAMLLQAILQPPPSRRNMRPRGRPRQL